MILYAHYTLAGSEHISGNYTGPSVGAVPTVAELNAAKDAVALVLTERMGHRKIKQDDIAITFFAVLLE